ncbi:MAG: DinB family protein [Bacteroidia bacterium]|nr:DinB family protein [Bacteroidia bacterium]
MTNQIMVKMVLDTWYSKIKEADDIFNKLTDEQLQKAVVPNRNSGIYLLGHLAAVHDRMLPLLGLGERFYPQLDKAFIDEADNADTAKTPAAGLRESWKKVNEALSNRFNNLKPDEWFQKHNSVSAEDFIKEPNRNKLNVVINRTNHLSYHTGQIIFLEN